MLSAVIAVSVCVCFSNALISNIANKGYNDNENEQYTKEEALSSDNQNSANHFTDNLPGDPALDYPTYTDIPRTGFSCQGKVNWRYYADIETDCQVFHVCETEYSKISFVCPIGSIFNQRHLVCDWWYNVNCNDAESLYVLKIDLEREQQQLEEDQENVYDLSLASSGGNPNPSEKSKLKDDPEKNEKKTGPSKSSRRNQRK